MVAFSYFSLALEDRHVSTWRSLCVFGGGVRLSAGKGVREDEEQRGSL